MEFEKDFPPNSTEQTGTGVRMRMGVGTKQSNCDLWPGRQWSRDLQGAGAGRGPIILPKLRNTHISVSSFNR